MRLLHDGDWPREHQRHVRTELWKKAQAALGRPHESAPDSLNEDKLAQFWGLLGGLAPCATRTVRKVGRSLNADHGILLYIAFAEGSRKSSVGTDVACG